MGRDNGKMGRRGKALLSALGAFALGVTACKEVVLISPYDAMIETRLQDYRDDLNTLVKRAGNSQESGAGTYDASKDSYAALEAKIEGIVDRAKLQDQGIGCKLDEGTWSRIKKQFANAAGLPVANPDKGDGSGCIVMMLSNVQKNLADVKAIHADPTQCVSASKDFPTCLRPATVKDLLSISNQTIDAVLFVENQLNRAKS
jgi:hypothetical protein